MSTDRHSNIFRDRIATAIASLCIGLLVTYAVLLLKKRPIHEAAVRGDNSAIHQILLRNPEYIEQRGPYDRTPLQTAAWYNNYETVRVLLKLGADKEARWKQNSRETLGWTSLHIAAHRNSYETLVILIDSQCNISAVTDNGDTPCDIATQFGNTKCADVLCKALK
jgi:uncharacterized protein